jgi:hypothetical protein
MVIITLVPIVARENPIAPRTREEKEMKRGMKKRKTRNPLLSDLDHLLLSLR